MVYTPAEQDQSWNFKNSVSAKSCIKYSDSRVQHQCMRWIIINIMDYFFDLLLDGHYVVILNKPNYFLKLSQCPGPCRRFIGFVRFKAVFGRDREGLTLATD